MAIAHSVTDSDTVANGTTTTISGFTVSGTNPVLVLTVSLKGADLVGSATWNTTEDFILEVTDINGDARVAILYLPAPTATTADVVVTLDGNSRYVSTVSLYTGADQATPVRSAASVPANGNNNAPTLDITGISGEMIINGLCQVSADPDSATGNRTERSNLAATGGGTDTRGATQEFLATGSADTMSWSMGGSDSWANCAMVLQEPFTPSNFPGLYYHRMMR